MSSVVVSAPEGGAGSSRTLASRLGVQEEVGARTLVILPELWAL